MKKIVEFSKNYFIGIILLGMIVIFGVSRPESFLTTGNLFTVLRQVSISGVMSMGLLFVMVSGGIDLAIGAMVSLSGCVTAILMVEKGMNSLPAALIGMLLTTIIGFVMGGIIIKIKIWPMIGTIAEQTILFGLASMLTRGLPVSGIPDGFKKIAQAYIGIVPVPVVLFIIIVVITGIILNFTYAGRYFYLVGSNAEASRLSGVNTDWVQISAYAISGLLSGFAGIIMLGRIGTGMSNVGVGLEMDCLTALVIGGISLSGGEGKISKAVIGILFMGVLLNGMIISEYSQQVIKGLVFLTAVCSDNLTKMFSSR